MYPVRTFEIIQIKKSNLKVAHKMTTL